jgi:hypothetical protein
MNAPEKLDQAAALLQQAANEFHAAKVPAVTLRKLDSITHELLAYIDDLPAVIAEDVLDEGLECYGCQHHRIERQRLPCGSTYAIQETGHCEAVSPTECPVVKRAGYV